MRCACDNSRLLRFPGASPPRAALRDSIAIEVQAASTLAAELAELEAQPAELAAAAAEAAAARDNCADLEDAVAAQRMELERLRSEAQRADQFILRQARYPSLAAHDCSRFPNVATDIRSARSLRSCRLSLREEG